MSQAIDTLDLYTSDRYLRMTHGAWHLEDSPFKAKYAHQLIARNGLQPNSACEIGCGAGGVLHCLSQSMPNTHFTGYEISSAALDLGRHFESAQLQFVQGDAFVDCERYDLALIMDVVEHVEDCFEFLRQSQSKATYKVYHIPLEITCSSILRDLYGAGYSLGHIHHFSQSSAIAALEHTGHHILDSCLTPVAFECSKQVKTRGMNLLRSVLPSVWATRLVGGYSLMVLAE
jgi:hypothetical protein